MDHVPFMHRCLELAELGRGKVGNGAFVGAVLVRRGQIITEGHYRAYGALHAEADLLERFQEPIEPEDTLYVNLEPCCHQGKTPPCTDAIIQRGIRHVVYGMVDPDPRVAGKGIEVLRKAGVEVLGPIERARCEYLNRGFISVRTKGRPWITLKMAYSRAGSISNPDGSPLKITSHEQDVWSHTFLRSRVDAILVGVQTVINDNPSLNTRFAQKRPKSGAENSNKELEQYQPWRIVLDPYGRAPLYSKILKNYGNRTMLIVGSEPEAKKEQNFSIFHECHIKIMEVPLNNDIFEWSLLWRAFIEPHVSTDYIGLTSILVEGGKRTSGIFRANHYFDDDVSLQEKK